MKAIVLITTLSLFGTALMAQSQIYNMTPNAQESLMLRSDSKQHSRDWSEYNVLYSQTFDSADWHTAQSDGVAIPENMPNGWSVVDNTGNDFVWRWSTTGARGRYTSPAEGVDALVVPNNDARVKSRSDEQGEKGFLLLECDLYNTTPEGEMANPSVEMDSYIQFGPIDLSSATYVWLYFEQYHRFCCNPIDENSGPKFLVSLDGDNWTQFSVEGADINATPVMNPSVCEMSVSHIAAGQSSVYFRFHLMNESHYYWAIDDIYIFEPLQYNMRVIDYWVDYYRESEGEGYSKQFSEPPYFCPYFTFQEFLSSSARISNQGWDTIRDITLTTKIMKESEVVFEATSDTIDSNVLGVIDSLGVNLNYQIPNIMESMGRYLCETTILSSTEESDGSDNLFLSEFNITSNLYGYLNPDNAESHKASHLVTYSSTDGDGIGFISILDPSTEYMPETTITAPYVLQGVNVFILDNHTNYTLWQSGDVANFKVEVYEHIQEGEEYVFDLSAPVASSELIPIDSTFAGKWLYIPFQTEGEVNTITPPAAGTQYLVLLRMYTNDRFFYIGAEQRSKYSFYSQFYTVGNDSYEGMGYMNYAMELLINNYGETPSSNIHFNISTNTNQEGASPATGAVVTVYTTSDGNTLVENTQTVDNSGMVTFEDIPSGTYSYDVSYQSEVIEGSVTAFGQDIMKEVNFNFVGIDNPELSNSWKLYPNPTQNLLTIEMDEEVKQITITNIMGQEMFVLLDPKERVNVDVSSLNTGIYLVWITTENRQKTTKMFVKQ